MSQNRKIIEKEWQSFAKVVIPSDAPKVQFDEMRKSFYAGVHSILAFILKSLTPDAEPTKADLDMMDDIEHELKEYAVNLKNRKNN